MTSLQQFGSSSSSEDLYRRQPRTAAQELADHIDDCASMFPKHLLAPSASIASIRPSRCSSHGTCDAVSELLDDKRCDGSAEAVKGHLASLTCPAVVADMHFIPLSTPLSDAETRVEQEPKHVRVYFSFSEGFQLCGDHHHYHSSIDDTPAHDGTPCEDELVCAAREHGEVFESLMSFLIHYGAHDNAAIVSALSVATAAIGA